MKQLIRHDAIIDVPSEIAVCPCCDGPLAFTGEEWVHNDDGTVSVDIIYLKCTKEEEATPYDFGFDNWAQLNEKVEDWANDHYDFDLVDWDKKLEKWREAVERI